MTPAERHGEWKRLQGIYMPWVRLDGQIPFYGDGEAWQRQSHIYASPFYYIDYCLAQTAAFQFLLASRTDYDDGVTMSFGDDINCSEPERVSIDGQTLTIKNEGTYVLSGKLANGSVIIDAPNDAKIQLVLGGVEIYSADFAAIYVKQADKVFITLSAGTENILSNGGSFESLDENNVDAVIFSKDDLSFNGEGSLRIKSPAGNGVCSKDDLVFTGGTYTVTAEGHALEANDSVRICGGSFALDSGKDGIHCENDGAEPGFVYITGGSFDILSDGDAISANGCVQLDGGTFDLNCGGGSSTVTQSGDEFKCGSY